MNERYIRWYSPWINAAVLFVEYHLGLTNPNLEIRNPKQIRNREMFEMAQIVLNLEFR